MVLQALAPLGVGIALQGGTAPQCPMPMYIAP